MRAAVIIRMISRSRSAGTVHKQSSRARAIDNVRGRFDAARRLSSVDLSSVLRFRYLIGQFIQRINGSRNVVATRRDLMRLCTAAAYAERLDTSMHMSDLLPRIHGIALGSRRPSSLRNAEAACRARYRDGTSRIWKIKVSPKQIGASLARIDSILRRDEDLDPFARAVLTYYEILHTHPFPDGNGRVARLLLGRYLGDLFVQGIPMDLTFAMRGSMKRYNALLNADRSPEVYQNFVCLFWGLLLAELGAIERLANATSMLHKADQFYLQNFLRVAVARAAQDGELDRIFEAGYLGASQQVQWILKAAAS